MRHKLIGVSAIAVAATMLAGCSIATTPDSGSTVLNLTYQSGGWKFIDTVVQKFEDDNPGVTVKVRLLSTEDIYTTVLTEIAAGKGPDVTMVGVERTGLMDPANDPALLAPLDDIPWVKDAAPSAVTNGTVNGHVLSATPGGGPVGAIYNMDTLDTLGLSIPETWSDLLTFCGDARNAGKIAFGLGLQNGWTTQLLMWALLASDIKNVDEWNASLADGSFTFEDSAWSKALKQQQDMIDAGCFNDSPAGTDIDTAVLPGVVNGDYLGVVTVNAHGGTMETLAGKPLNLSLAPIPTTDDPTESKLYTLYTAGFGVNANSKHIDLATKLVEAFTTTEGVNLYADEAGAIPSIANDAFTAKPFLQESASIIGDNRVASGDWTPGADTLTALTNGVQGIVIGTSTPDDMLSAMQQGYETYLKQIGVKK